MIFPQDWVRIKMLKRVSLCDRQTDRCHTTEFVPLHLILGCIRFWFNSLILVTVAYQKQKHVKAYHIRQKIACIEKIDVCVMGAYLESIAYWLRG